MHGLTESYWSNQLTSPDEAVLLLAHANVTCFTTRTVQCFRSHQQTGDQQEPADECSTDTNAIYEPSWPFMVLFNMMGCTTAPR